jgi:hypothetical protein
MTDNSQTPKRVPELPFRPLRITGYLSQKTAPPLPSRPVANPNFYLKNLQSLNDLLNEQLKETKGHIQSHAENLADTQKEIICIKCSIKKLELDMKLTNDDSIDNEEFISLINEIIYLCEKCGCNDKEIKIFTENAIMKRCMNKVNAFIKIAVFICPTLSNVNSVLTKMVKKSTKQLLISNTQIGKAQQMCTFIVAYLYGTGIIGNDTKKFIKNAEEVVDYVGKLHDANIIEYLVNPFKFDFLEPIIAPVKDIINEVINNTSPQTFQKLSPYQKLISIVFISYLSINILLNMAIYSDEYTEKLYATNFTNFTNITGNFTLINDMYGGKRSRQKKQQSSKKTTKAAKAAKILKLKKPKLKRKN